MIDSVIEKTTVFFMWFLIILGIGLPVFQFFYNRSLWIDEAYLIVSYKRDYLGLLRPLEINQVAPILFLLVVKFFSELFPNTEYGFRLFPLLCYLASIFFFYRLIKIFVKNKIAILFGLTLFLLNHTLLYFATEFKQYIVDVLCIVMLYYFTLKHYNNKIFLYVNLFLLGVVFMGFSNITPIVLLTLGFILVIQQFQNKCINYKNINLLFGGWLLFYSLYFYLFIHSHPAKHFMVNWWSSKNAFLPLNIFDFKFYNFLVAKYFMIFREQMGLGVKFAIPLSLIYILGLYSLLKTKRFVQITFLVFPILIHLCLSALKLYPFHNRISLYFAPITIITIGLGMEFILLQVKNYFLSLYSFSIFLIPLLWIFIFFRHFPNNFPIKGVRDTKSAINYIHLNSKESDAILVPTYVSASYLYYEDIGYINYDLNTIYADYFDEGNTDYLKNLNQVEGRIWIFNKPFYQNITLFDLFNSKEFILLDSANSDIHLYELKNK